MQTYSTIDGEMGLYIKRPKKGRVRAACGMIFMVAICVFGIVHTLINDHTFWEGTLSVVFLVGCGWYVMRYCLDEIAEQTFFINQNGITNMRYGKRCKHFNWDSFVAIEKHTVLIEYGYEKEAYEAVICSTRPIICKTKGYSEPCLTWNYHREKKNKPFVVELVLEKDQFADFLSYIPKEILNSDIVKI